MNRTHLVLFFSCIGLISFVIWVVGNYHGLGLTHDSFYYLDLASKSGLFIEPQQLLSYLLYVFGSHDSAGWWINLISYTGVLLLWGRLILNSNLSEWFKILGFGFLALNITLLSVASFLWTEILYVFVTSIAYTAYSEWRNSGNVRWIILVIIMLPLAVWSRKIGVVFTAVMVFVLISDLIDSKKARRLAAFGFVISLFIYWRFFYQGETPHAVYIWRNFIFNLNALINWVLPVNLPAILRYLFLFIGIGAFVSIKAKGHVVNRLTGYYFLVYFLIRLPVEREFSEEADRYFSILFAPFVLYMCCFFQSFSEKYRVGKQVVVGMLVALVIVGSVRSMKNAWMWNRNRLENQKLEITS